MATWRGNLHSHGIAARAAMLGGVGLAALAIVGPLAFRFGGFIGLTAAALALALCLAGAVIALVASHLLRGPHYAIAALLVGMTSRMCIPLAFALAVHLRGGPLAEGGLLYYLLVFYPVTLAVETALSLPRAVSLGQASSNAAS